MTVYLIQLRREHQVGGQLLIYMFNLCYSSISSYSLFLLKCTFLGFNDFADPNSTTPLFHLVNRTSLDRILQSEVYVNEADSQLRAAHLILGYTPSSRAFQAPRCVIRAKDPRLHHISVAYEGFVVPEGIPLPKSTPFTQSFPVATLFSRSIISLAHSSRRGGRRRKTGGAGLCGPN